MKAIAVAITAFGLAWAIITYFLSKRSALALERTKFIFENLRFFETDPSLQVANRILYGFADDFTIESFLKITNSNQGTPEEIANCIAIDNCLGFLWRVAYAHLTLKTITLDDLDAFGYYFYVIYLQAELMEYCIQNGFEEIVDAIEKLKPVWTKADIRNASRIAEIKKRHSLEEASRKVGS